jgi:FAD/FMN-containing dehydrogenase
LLDKSKISHYTDEFAGQLIQPEHPEYNKVRKVWNGMVDRCPALIARCMNANDIVSAVRLAREHDLAVSIKGGGHSVAGRSVCEGGLMIDLSGMREVKVDPERKIASVEPGAILADMDSATQKYGLATTGGLVSETGVAGLTLGGGLGYLARRFGLTIDNLISADVVTADGKLIRASEEENPDLFWALRGGGGNFGIVTSFEFQLHNVGPDVLAAQIFYPYEDAEHVLHAYRDLMAKAPDELACYALAANVPPADPFPKEYHGQTCIALVACYSGAHEDGLPLLKPLQKLGNPILNVLAPMPYVALQQSFDASMPDGGRYYWKGDYVNEITDEAIDKFIANIDTLPGIFTLVGFEPMGGAISRVEPSATAFAHREPHFALGIWAGWTDPSDDDEIIAWTRRFHDAMEPHTTGGVYANYLDQDDDGRIKNAYGSNLDRLKKVKAKYDLDNFFRNNHNISPGK